MSFGLVGMCNGVCKLNCEVDVVKLVSVDGGAI